MGKFDLSSLIGKELEESKTLLKNNGLKLNNIVINSSDKVRGKTLLVVRAKMTDAGVEMVLGEFNR